jgi:hypothetical protein
MQQRDTYLRGPVLFWDNGLNLENDPASPMRVAQAGESVRHVWLGALVKRGSEAP